MSRRTRHARPGATLLECAIAFPLTFVVILGLVVGGLGIFRYQEVAHLARLGARYASTHGGKYQEDGIPQKTGVPAITSSADLRRVYLQGPTLTEGSLLTLLNPDDLQVEVSWSEAGKVTPQNYPSYADPNDPTAQRIITNTITVRVTYRWTPELFLVPITLRSTSTMPMSY